MNCFYNVCDFIVKGLRKVFFHILLFESKKIIIYSLIKGVEKLHYRDCQKEYWLRNIKWKNNVISMSLWRKGFLIWVFFKKLILKNRLCKIFWKPKNYFFQCFVQFSKIVKQHICKMIYRLFGSSINFFKLYYKTSELERQQCIRLTRLQRLHLYIYFQTYLKQIKFL